MTVNSSLKYSNSKWLLVTSYNYHRDLQTQPGFEWITPLTAVNINEDQCNFYRASYALAVYAMAVCLSVCVCLSQVGVLLKWLNIGTRKQRHTIAQGLYFFVAKNFFEIRTGSPPTGAPNGGGVG